MYTLDEFLKIEEQSDVPLEFINGSIYAKSFTSINHNKIVTRINSKIDDYLQSKPCMVLSEQIEVILGEDSRIKEYNLVYQEGEIHQYKLNEFGVYYLNKSYKKNDEYKSVVFTDLKINIDNIFRDLL